MCTLFVFAHATDVGNAENGMFYEVANGVTVYVFGYIKYSLFALKLSLSPIAEGHCNPVPPK